MKIVIDQEADQVLAKLSNDYAAKLLARAARSTVPSEGRYIITGVELRRAASSSDMPRTPQTTFIAGISVLIGVGIAISAIFIPAHVHNDVYAVLLSLAVFGLLGVLLGIVGMVLARKPGITATASELRTQLIAMREAAQPFLSSSARVAFWSEVWELGVIRAAARAESNRKQFYGFRLTAIISAIIVPALVGLSFADTGGTIVHWLTFTLSLVAALSTAILMLFRFRDRWLMYRTLSNELINAGWALVNSPHKDLDKPWATLTAATRTAISSHNAEYSIGVITAAQPETVNQNDSQDEK